MKAIVVTAVLAVAVGAGGRAAIGTDDDDDRPAFPRHVSFKTLIRTPFAIEGLTGDDAGNLYTTGRGSPPTRCPVWRIHLASPTLDPVGSIPNPTGCNPSGITFDRDGNLYIADAASGGVIWKVVPGGRPSERDPVAPFATGVPGTNGLAFDRDGNLWTGDGTTGQGRVWKITPAGEVSEEFRIQPMANEVNLEAGVGGVGRDVRDLPPGTIAVTATSRNAANTAGSQPLVANGVAFNRRRDLLVADTARGAIWRVKFDDEGKVKSRMGCDTTFTPNTLCLENVLVAHPLLEGTDGIALDQAGNIWNAANERNAIVVVTRSGRVIELFRSDPDPVTHLRNTGPLEFPTSPFLMGHKLCVANSDGNRRDNSPSTAGEVKPAGPDRAKISCLEQALAIPGLPLPVR